MVVSPSIASEPQNGATKESIVLSRIRMLDARLTNGDKSSPSTHTRKYVHPFNRTTKNNFGSDNNKILANSSPQLTEQQQAESRDTESSNRPTQNSYRDTVLSRPSPPKIQRSYPPNINTDQEHLSQIRNSPRCGGGSPLSRDDTAHKIQPNQTNSDAVTNSTGRNSSPAKPIRYSPSRIPSRTINVEQAPVMPDNNRAVAESPFKAIHPFNELQKKKENNQTSDVSPTVKNATAAVEKQPNSSSAEKVKALPSRVALHFARNDAPSPMKTRTDSPAKNVPMEEDSKNRAHSPGGTRLTLQRYHWDKGNNGNAGVTTKASSQSLQKPLSSPRNSNQVLKPEPESGKVLPFQTKIQREYRKIPPSPKRRPAMQQNNESTHSSTVGSTLQRNLNAASAVMYEEKISSVGSSSSSGRSGLSQSELGGIAAKAIKLSEGNTNKMTKPRLGTTTLQQIATTKRTSQYSSQGVEASKPDTMVPYAYSSAQRLSERLTRAERFTALKNAKHTSRGSEPQSNHNHNASYSPAMSDNYAHPVFGYPKTSIAVNTTLAAEEKPVLSPEPSCVRRSKHLSKSLQNKANQFASASPTRRLKGNNTGFGNSPQASASTQHRSHDQMSASRDHPQMYFSPDQQRERPQTYFSQDQQRYDPLGLQATRQSHSQVNRRTTPSYATPTDMYQQLSYRSAHHQPNSPTTRHLNPNVPSKFAPKQALGVSHKVDRKNSHPVNYNHIAPNVAGHILTPGQQLEILAREQRSKFQEDQIRHRAEKQHTTSEDNDADTNYSDDGVSSVDGDIFHNDPEPVSMNEISHIIRTSQIPHEYSRLANYPHDVNTNNNRQVGTFAARDDQPSYRHVSKRPEPIPMKHQSESTPAGCDNTFTGSLNNVNTIMTPFTAHDNTFTGSLNPHKILQVNDSSDSSAAKPDAFRWLHQKYGNQAAIVPVVETRNPNKPTGTHVPSNIPIATRNLGNDEDDDVFFGLDEDKTEDDLEQSGKERSSARTPSPQRKKETSATTGRGKVSSAKANAEEIISQSNDEKLSSENTESSDVERNGLLSESDYASLGDEKEQKKRHRPFPVETIMDEARAALSGPHCIEREVTVGDDEADQDENKPPTSVLKNLGSAIVKSIQRACAIPEELPDLGGCAMNAKVKCEEKMSEAWVGLDESENVTHGDASRTSKTTETGGALNENYIGVDTMEQDERSQTSESSSNLQSQSQFMDHRKDAERKLLHHAETAMSLFGNNNTTVLEFDDTDKVQQQATLSTDSSTTQGPKPLSAEQSPKSKQSESLSLDQRMVLQTFSTCLKKGGVEVLKLSRWNIWQVRHLTISREAVQLKDGEDENDAAKCPKALLWLKETGKLLQNRSLSSMKNNGRGGMLFESMKQVVPIESNEYYDKNLPKRLKKKFPEFAGVLLHYMLNGNDRHVHFCFKTKQDALSFVTTMRIIQEVGKRAAVIESVPTTSSGTKSQES